MVERPPADVIVVAMVVPMTEAEGPGRRFAVWVQGCPMRCPSCCNPEMQPFEGGSAMTIGELRAQILDARDTRSIEGVTLLGGEPFSQPRPLAALARLLRRDGLSVMVFTGHTLEALESSRVSGVAELLAETDLLVDGPFESDRPDRRRRWIGSENQHIYVLAEGSHVPSPSWDTSGETLEIRIVDGKLIANGSPELLERLRRP